MHLLTLSVYTIVFILAHGSFVFFFLKMIEPDGLLDLIFNWQKMLDYTYGHKYKAVEMAGKALGNCGMCTCFWASFVSFFFYRGLAIELGLFIVTGWASLVWLWLYWGLSAMYSYWFITKSRTNGL